MKITLIDECIDRVGGVERVICTLANKMVETNEINVISEFKLSEKPFYDYKQDVNIKYLIDNTNQKTTSLKQKNIKYYFYRFFEKIKMSVLLNRRIKKFIVNSKLMTNSDVIIFGRVFTALHFLPFIKKEKNNCKIIVRDAIHLKYYDSKIQKKILKYFPNMVDKFIVSSDESINAYLKFFNDDTIHLEKIYNPLGIKPNVKYNFSNKKIVSIGRLDDQKGFECLINAVSLVHDKHKDWCLESYGSGSYEKNVRDEISKLNANEFIKIYHTTHDIVNVFNNSSIFVLPSRYEGYANILVEAMSCGMPCISYNWLMGVEEIIKDNENGKIVPLENRDDYFFGKYTKSDIQNLANMITYLIENPEVCDSLSHNAAKIIDSRRLDKIIEEWMKIIGVDN